MFEATVHDLRTLLRLAQGRKTQPSAVILTLSGHSGQSHFAADSREWRACSVRWAKRKKGSKTHMAVDTLGDLVTPANEQDRDQVQQLTSKV